MTEQPIQASPESILPVVPDQNHPARPREKGSARYPQVIAHLRANARNYLAVGTLTAGTLISSLFDRGHADASTFSVTPTPTRPAASGEMYRQPQEQQTILDYRAAMAVLAPIEMQEIVEQQKFRIGATAVGTSVSGDTQSIVTVANYHDKYYENPKIVYVSTLNTSTHQMTEFKAVAETTNEVESAVVIGNEVVLGGVKRVGLQDVPAVEISQDLGKTFNTLVMPFSSGIVTDLVQVPGQERVIGNIRDAQRDGALVKDGSLVIINPKTNEVKKVNWPLSDVNTDGNLNISEVSPDGKFATVTTVRGAAGYGDGYVRVKIDLSTGQSEMVVKHPELGSLGQVYTIKDSEGKEITFGWRNDSKTLFRIDQDDQVTSFSYDSLTEIFALSYDRQTRKLTALGELWEASGRHPQVLQFIENQDPKNSNPVALENKVDAQAPKRIINTNFNGIKGHIYEVKGFGLIASGLNPDGSFQSPIFPDNGLGDPYVPATETPTPTVTPTVTPTSTPTVINNSGKNRVFLPLIGKDS